MGGLEIGRKGKLAILRDLYLKNVDLESFLYDLMNYSVPLNLIDSFSIKGKLNPKYSLSAKLVYIDLRFRDKATFKYVVGESKNVTTNMVSTNVTEQL